MRRMVQCPHTVPVLAYAAVLAVVSVGCSESPVKPDLSERAASTPRLSPQSGGLSCTEPDARLSSGAPFRVCVDPTNWNRDLVVFILGYDEPARPPGLPRDPPPTAAAFLLSGLGCASGATGVRAAGLLEPAGRV